MKHRAFTNKVYIIGAYIEDGFMKQPYFYKIGVSADPDERLKQLQTATPLRLRLEHVHQCACTSDARKLEQMLHKELSMHRVRGEWFGAAAYNVILMNRLLIT